MPMSMRIQFPLQFNAFNVRLVVAGSCVILASHAGVFRGARISSLPTNACSTEDNIPFPLLHSRGK